MRSVPGAIATGSDRKGETDNMPEPSMRQSKKEIAISFLEGAASGKLDEAYNLVGANFRHHNAYFPGDAESLKAGMADAHQQFPNTTLAVQHVLEDGDLIAVHSRVQHSPDTPEIAVVHLFRFEGDRIAELWDVGMEAPKDSPNENGLF
jgi:predicted SnoaL-like aldol condensation-catalyzing enzyme